MGIRKEEKPTINENVTEECSSLINDMVSKTVKQIDSSESEQKMPPIIVKIPKVAISPKKISKKENIKSPSKSCIKNLDFAFSKQPTVSIKNLKILPPVPPEVTEAILELANADEEISDSKKVEDKKPSTPKPSPTKLQTPPPLSVIKNKRKVKSPEATSEKILEQKDKEKQSIVTVLKMSEIVSMKQKEEELDRQNDLKKMLELENKLKDEDMSKIKEDKIHEDLAKKVSSKASPKPKAGKEPKPTKQLAEIKTCILNSELEEEVSSVKKLESDSIKVTPKANLTESHKPNDLEKLLELENKIKIEDRKRMKEEKRESYPEKQKQNRRFQSKRYKTIKDD